MTSYQPRVGDIIKYEGIITDVHHDTISVNSSGDPKTDDHMEVLWIENVTLVERPEPKITVELSKSELKMLWDLRWPPGVRVSTYNKFTDAADKLGFSL